MVFCNKKLTKAEQKELKVTILILIDGFLQWSQHRPMDEEYDSHNPYFNRWFSAIS